jgi:hypothetical protein
MGSNYKWTQKGSYTCSDVGAKRYTGAPVNRDSDGHDTRIVSRVGVPVRTDTPNKYLVLKFDVLPSFLSTARRTRRTNSIAIFFSSVTLLC